MMPARTLRRTTSSRQYPSPPHRPTACTAVVCLDGSKIKKKAVQALKRARTAYAKAEREWTYYVETESPAFQRWIHVECGPLFARIREADEKLRYYGHLLSLMEREYLLTQASPRTCYDRAKERLEHPERFRHEWEDPPPGAGPEDGGGPFGDPGDEAPSDEADEVWEDLDEWVRMFEGLLGRPSPEAPPPPDEGRLKSLYRQLTRKLHPDANHALSSEQRELWHQVQTAYAEKDVERLELLLIHADLADGRVAPQSSVSSLLDLTQEIRQALKTLRNTIRKARTELSWGFLSWKPEHKRHVLTETKLELVEQAETQEQQLDHLLREVAAWKQAAPPPRDSLITLDDLWAEDLDPPRPRRRRAGGGGLRPDQMEFGFY